MEEKIKNTKWLIASLVAIMVSAMMAGCGGSSGTPLPDSNTTTGGDDNTTTGGGTEVANTKLTIQKSDLGDCQDMRVQVWATKLTYQSSPPLLLENDPSLYFVKEYNDQNISDNGGADGNYTIDLGEHITINKYRDSAVNTVLRDVTADDPELSKPIRLHATVFCGERSWGMKSLSYDMDNTSKGFYKSPFSLVLMFGRTFPEDDDPEYPDEINQGRPLSGLVYGVQSSISMYADFPTNSPNSVDKTSMIKNGYEVYWWDKENVQLHNEKGYVWDNNSTPRWEYGDDVHGYIDAGTSPAVALTTDGYVWFTAKITLHNGEASYGDIIFNTEGETYLNFGIENYPSWMPTP